MTKSITIKNFNLSKFSNLLVQSLIVNPQLMLEFNETTIKSCSFSSTKSLIKLWTIPYEELIISEGNSNQLSIEDDIQDLTPKGKLDIIIEPFNFYIFRGDSFLKYLSIFNSEPVELTFNLINQNNKLQATSLIINGKSSSAGTKLKTTFPLTSEELITNIVSDYSEILRICSPEESFIQFGLSQKQNKEIRDLIKKLKGAGVDNSAFLVFTIDTDNNTLHIKDSVFNTAFPLVSNKQITSGFSFKILKSDLVLSGNLDYTIYTDNETQKVIFIGKHLDAYTVCMATKVGDIDSSVGSDDEDNEDINLGGLGDEDDILNSLNLSEYGDI